jgi:hypothetical protein
LEKALTENEIRGEGSAGRFVTILVVAVVVGVFGFPYAHELRAEPAPSPNSKCCGDDKTDCCGCVPTIIIGGTPRIQYRQLNAAIYKACRNELDSGNYCLDRNDRCFFAQAIQYYSAFGQANANQCLTTCATPTMISSADLSVDQCSASQNPAPTACAP